MLRTCARTPRASCFDRKTFRAEAYVGARLLRLASQYRFEDVLIAGGRLRRADSGRVRPGGAAPPNIGIGEGLAARDPTALLIAGAVDADFIFKAEAAEDLHAARRDAGELVLDRGVRVTLDKNTAGAVMRKQTGGRQAIQAATNQKNGILILPFLL